MHKINHIKQSNSELDSLISVNGVSHSCGPYQNLHPQFPLRICSGLPINQ